MDMKELIIEELKKTLNEVEPALEEDHDVSMHTASRVDLILGKAEYLIGQLENELKEKVSYKGTEVDSELTEVSTSYGVISPFAEEKELIKEAKKNMAEQKQFTEEEEKLIERAKENHKRRQNDPKNV